MMNSRQAGETTQIPEQVQPRIYLDFMCICLIDKNNPFPEKTRTRRTLNAQVSCKFPILSSCVQTSQSAPSPDGLMNTIDPNAYKQPIPEFDGYSTYEMAWILFNPIQPDSPMQLNPLTEDLIRRIPMLNVALFLMNMLHDSGEIKLTATGNLPLKLVKAMHEMAQVPDERLDTGMSKIRSQQDVILVDLLRALLDFARLTKKAA